MKSFSCLWCLFVTLFASLTCTESKNRLFVLMIDGFRWDYFELQKGQLKAFESIMEEGVRAEWVHPIFPTLSYPSWTTLSTGLYAENHNIVGNFFYDSELQETFALFDRSKTQREHWWASIEPIWTTATKFQKRAALFQWSRCDVKIKNTLPEVCEGFTSNPTFEGVNVILNKSLKKLEEGFDLVMSYLEPVDNYGHKFGPESPKCKEAVRYVDGALQKFLNKFRESGLIETVNMIIVSDHGMTWVGYDSKVEYVSLRNYLNASDVQLVLDRGAMVAVVPLVNRKEQVYQQLKKMPGVNVYKKEEIPERYHYAKSRLVPDIVLVAKKGYFIDPLGGDKQIPSDEGNREWGGTHGYDPDEPDMRSIFLAIGPDFKKSVVHPPIEMVDIYQLYSHLLGIPPRAHNGSWDRVQEMLVGSAQHNCSPVISVFLILPMILMSWVLVLF